MQVVSILHDLAIAGCLGVIQGRRIFLRRAPAPLETMAISAYRDKGGAPCGDFRALPTLYNTRQPTTPVHSKIPRDQGAETSKIT